MELIIADLFDVVDASDVSIKPSKITSKSRIKELVFNKISLNERQKHTVRKSVRMGVLIAALISILSFSIFVGASELRGADFFGDFFGLLSQGQKYTIDEISMSQGGEVPISANTNGTTVTLQTAIGDDHNCYLKLQFNSKENKKLSIPEKNSGTLEIFEKEYYESPEYVALLTDRSGERLYCYHELTWIDSVPGDNLLELIVELSLPMDSSVSFIDDEPEILVIPGIWTRSLSGVYTQLIAGPWMLELGKCGGQFRDLNVDGKIATYTVDGKINTVLLESAKLSQLGLEVKGSFETTENVAYYYAYPMPMVVLKDQTMFQSYLFTGDQYDRGNGELNEERCDFSVKFEGPLDLKLVDHVRIGDLVMRFPEDGSVFAECSDCSEDGLALGTHITLGEPESLRSSETISSLDDIGVHSPGSITAQDWYDSWLYAEHTEKGVQLAHIDSEFESGKLVYTITAADVITNICDLSTKQNGFSYEACLVLDNNNEWQKLDRPGCICEDGSFEDGWHLVLLDISVKNDNAILIGEEPFLFDAGRLLTLVDLRYKTVGNYRCQYIDYFSGLDAGSSQEFSFYLEPGEEKSFTIGYLIQDSSGKMDFSALRACTTTGGEMSAFVNLKLDEKTAS